MTRPPKAFRTADGGFNVPAALAAFVALAAKRPFGVAQAEVRKALGLTRWRWFVVRDSALAVDLVDFEGWGRTARYVVRSSGNVPAKERRCER